MAKNIPFHVSADQISSECNSKQIISEDKKDVMSDGRMWMNSRSWCTLNLNNISLYFLHSRLNMTPVVYRFISVFSVFPFDFFVSKSRINPAYA